MVSIDLKYRDRQSGKTTKLLEAANTTKFSETSLIFVINDNIARSIFDKTNTLILTIPRSKKELKKILKAKRPYKIFLDEFDYMPKESFEYLIKYSIKNNIKVLGYSSNQLIDKLALRRQGV
jgi:thymidine kinase